MGDIGTHAEKLSEYITGLKITHLCADLTIFVNTVQKTRIYAKYAAKWQKTPAVHIEIDTGLSRYGIRWTEAVEIIAQIMTVPGIRVEGIMSHFATNSGNHF